MELLCYIQHDNINFLHLDSFWNVAYSWKNHQGPKNSSQQSCNHVMAESNKLKFGMSLKKCPQQFYSLKREQFWLGWLTSAVNWMTGDLSSYTSLQPEFSQLIFVLIHNGSSSGSHGKYNVLVKCLCWGKKCLVCWGKSISVLSPMPSLLTFSNYSYKWWMPSVVKIGKLRNNAALRVSLTTWCVNLRRCEKMKKREFEFFPIAYLTINSLYEFIL